MPSGSFFYLLIFSHLQFIKYHAEVETKQQNISIMEKKSLRGVEINQKRVIHINLDVPSLPPTDEMTSSIIKIRYFIRVSGIHH